MNYENLPVRCSNTIEKKFCYEGWHYFLNQDAARLKKALEDDSNDMFVKLYKTALLIQGRNVLLDSDVESIVNNLKKLGTEVPCSHGCSACCEQAIVATPFESFLISMYLVHNQQHTEKFFDNYAVWLTDTQSYRHAYMDWAQKFYTTGNDDGRFKNDDFTAKCPFLVDHACLIYPVRPYCCRSYIAVSRQCSHPEDTAKRPGFGGMDAGSHSGFNRASKSMNSILWGYLGVDERQTRLQLMPLLVCHSLTENFEGMFEF